MTNSLTIKISGHSKLLAEHKETLSRDGLFFKIKDESRLESVSLVFMSFLCNIELTLYFFWQKSERGWLHSVSGVQQDNFALLLIGQPGLAPFGSSTFASHSQENFLKLCAKTKISEYTV
jgi:hypothetical protein